MTALELASKLDLPAETLAALNCIRIPEDHGRIKELFLNDPQAFKEYAAGYRDGLMILRLYLEWANDTKARYDTLGIPEACFWDSIRDIAIWCDDYWQKNHIPGFLEWEWVGRTLRLEVIRIGRLQFEPTVLKDTVALSDRTFEAGSPMLDVHIPAGGPLDLPSVMASLDHAPAFFKKYFGQEFSLLHCHSWLLCPQLKELLPEQSRIIQFQNLFTVYKTDPERQAEERVFGFLADNADIYPENTSLQKSIKRYILEGKSVGMGAGIRHVYQ